MADTPQGHVDTTRKDLESALNTKLDFTASFSFEKHHPSAPNPALSVQQIGTIGLPLNQHDADAIKSIAEQAPFGKGERTVVDKTVRDTWEIDGSLVSFQNPNWDTFMLENVRHACKALGVNYAASNPRCELYKLLLYETGSHFLPHVDTEKADGMFATVIVVLPSHFTGGDAHLSHGSLSTVYNTSEGSGYQTTVLAWYTDVTHEIKPITSGYRLALAYNLIHTTQTLRPAISQNQTFSSTVKQVLVSWNEHAKAGLRVPGKVLYLLDHMYSQANLRASALKGADDHKIALLEVIARELGFHLGFASVTCRLQGSGDDDGYDSDPDPDSDSVGFLEVYEREVRIEDFVDLDGNVLTAELELDNDTETIPATMVSDIEAGPYDDQEYEGYMGNGAGSLERWYRRTVLVLWPDAKDCQVRFEGNRLEYELDRFDRPGLPDSSRAEVVDYLVNNAHEEAPHAGKRLSNFALDKKDSELWNRSVRAYSYTNGLSTFGAKEIVQALEVFGFDEVKLSIEHLLQQDGTNQRRYDTLQALKKWASGLHPEEQEAVLAWIDFQMDTLLRTLKKPAANEQGLLVDLAVAHGGIEFFRDSIFPQIKDSAEGPFLLSLATELFKNTQIPQCEIKDIVIGEVLRTSISQVKFEVQPPPPPTHSYGSWYESELRAQTNTTDPLVPLAQTIMFACSGLGHKNIGGIVLDKLCDIVGNHSDSDSRRRTEQIVLPILDFIQEKKVTTRTDPLPNFEKLLKLVVDAYLTPPPNSIFLTFNEKSVNTLFRVLSLIESPEVFFSCILPRFSQIPRDSTGLAFVFTALYDCQSQFTPLPDYTGVTIQGVIDTLVTEYIKSAPVSMSNLSQNADVFRQLLHIKAGASIGTYLDTRVFPNITQPALESLIYSLEPLISKYGADALAPACQKLMTAWVRTVLGKKPDSDWVSALSPLKRWSCTCLHCTRVKRFLNSNPDPVLRLERIGAPSRKHLEQQLNSSARTIATYDMIRSTPQGLTVTKSDKIWKPQRWQTTLKIGLALLQRLAAKEDDLKILLGEHYDSITSILRGTKRKEPPTNVVNGPTAGPSSAPLETSQPIKKRKVIPDPSTVIDLTSD